MKASELRKLLNAYSESYPNEDWEIVISISGEVGLGATPSVGVKNIDFGFDWDNGNLIVYPNVKLFRPSEQDEENRSIRSKVMEYLWDKKDVKPSFYTKQFLSCLKEKPKWFNKNEREE